MKMITIIFTYKTNQSQPVIIMLLKTPIVRQCPRTHAALGVCMDALIGRKKRTEKKVKSGDFVAFSMGCNVLVTTKLA